MNDPSPLLAAALSYAARGWRVVPLHAADPRGCSCGNADCGSPGKHPRTAHGLSDGTTDEQRIRTWWERWPRANVAIVCGRESGVWVVGPDGERGIADFERMQAEHGEIVAPLALSRTQGGGRHLFFAWPDDADPIKNRKNHRKTRIDVRAEGETGPGYVVAPPSVGPSGRYEWELPPGGASPAAPAWLVEWARADEERPAAAVPAARPLPAEPTQQQLHKRAVDYLARCPEAVSGQRGHDALFWAARVLVHGFALPEHEAFALLATFFNPRCKPQWSEKELTHKVRDAAEKGFNKPKGWLRASENPAAELPPPPRQAPAAAVPSGEWDTPIPLNSLQPAAPFPLDALPSSLALFCEATAAAQQVPVDFVASFLLGVSAGCVGATLDLQVGPGWREPPILWVAVVADVSAGKSPALAAVMRPVREAQAKARHAGGTEVYFTDDATAGGLVSLLRDQPRGTQYVNDELIGLLNSFGQFKNGQGNDRQIWLKVWDGSSFSTVRKNKDDKHAWALHPRCPVTGAIQPPIAAELFGRDDGLVERVLFSFADRVPRGRYRRGEGADATAWAAAVGRMLALTPVNGEFGPRPFPLQLTEAAATAFDDWYEEVARMNAAPGRDERLDATRSKMVGYAARLTLVSHVLHAVCSTARGPVPDRVEPWAVAAGVSLARYFLAHAERVRAMLAGTNKTDAEHVLGWVKRAKPASFKRRNVQMNLKRFKKARDIDAPLLLLVEHGYLKVVPKQHRDEESVFVPHPALLTVLTPVESGVNTSTPEIARG